MQLIVDAETTIDIKRNMSTLNEKTLTESLDVIQDIKSGLSNGYKENIQSHDNMISCDDKPVLENDKEEEVKTLKSPVPDESLNKESKDVNDIDNVDENVATENTKTADKIEDVANSQTNKEENTVLNDQADQDNIKDTIIISNVKVNSPERVEQLEKTESSKENIEQITEKLAPATDNNISCTNGDEDSDIKIHTVRTAEHKKNDDGVAEKDIEEINVENTVDENTEVSKTKSFDENLKIGDNAEIVEAVPEVVEKADKSAQVVVNLKDDKVFENVHEVKDDMPTDIEATSENKNQLNVEVSSQFSKEDNVIEINEAPQNLDNEIVAVLKDDIQISTEQDVVDSSTSSDSLMPNDVKVNEQSNNEKVVNVSCLQTNIEEIETVDLDDEEKETESSETFSVMNIDNESNTKTAIIDISDSTTDKKDNSVVSMETVDLDDEKDANTTEPMDVGINGETGETDTKKMPIITCKKDGLLKENLSTEQNFVQKINDAEVTNEVTSMDEDVHPAGKPEDSQKNENLISEPINIPDDGLCEIEKNKSSEDVKKPSSPQKTTVADELKNVPSILKLSNTLDILSDDEDEATDLPKSESVPQPKIAEKVEEKQCINIDDDDDIMLIDEEDTSSKEIKNSEKKDKAGADTTEIEPKLENVVKEKSVGEKSPLNISEEGKEVAEEKPKEQITIQSEEDVKKENVDVKSELPKPLVPSNFLKTCKKNMAEMTRDDLEEFCIVKIVESVVDRSSLSEIKTKLKSMAQCIEEYKKKAMMLTKQNRDLQVVLKTIQEEQKNSKTVTPLKITRSVGMQVLMTERSSIRRKVPPGPAANANNNNTPTKSPRQANQRPNKPASTPSPQQIPVPRLIPANSPAAKSNIPINNNTGKTTSPVNGVRTTPMKAEKRGINRNHSVTVDLTEDEPPTKIINRNSTPTPVRVVPPHMVPQNLLAATPRHPGQNNNPRKVYIPISGPQNPNARAGQAIVVKSVTAPNQNPRGKGPQHLARVPQNQIRMTRIPHRHPAPLPENTKSYPGTYLKALPPAPDLKLSKVENGIVISWKIEGYQEDSYEEIASYQLYAYQETNTPPTTALWKKIGDVKALPLPMACTLTQFMAGFKYYFAVRAVDIRSRIGPFSLPGSILLLNKL